MFDSIESAIKDIKNGKMVIVIDDENRENEGDFVMAAEKATPEAINFMAKYGRGLICTPITSKRAKALDLDYMVDKNNCAYQTAFTVSIDIKNGGTGISCSDRSATTLAISSCTSKASDFVKPGHIFPLIAKDGGVLERNGHTEAAVDLAKLAGCDSSGIICEIMNNDGTMARTLELKEIADKFNLKFITIKELISYRRKNEAKKISMTSKIDFPNKFGDFELSMYQVENSNEHHIAITKGDLTAGPTLIRLHSECFTGDIFGSLRCDCGSQLETSMKMIEKAGAGALIYLRQEGRGIGLPNKIKAYTLQDQGLDTVDANRALGFGDDLRSYNVAVSILEDLGVTQVKLLTNNPEKISALSNAKFEVVNRHPLEIKSHDMNFEYLKTKKNRMNHLFNKIQ